MVTRMGELLYLWPIVYFGQFYLNILYVNALAFWLLFTEKVMHAAIKFYKKWAGLYYG
jgi:hypothetical protein